jgi:beta-lactamase regulating signal transducer with metallopeptidase domain
MFLAFLQRNMMVSVVILVVLVVRFLLRHYPKKYSYWLWAIVGIRMVFQLPITSYFSLFNLIQLPVQSAQSAGTNLRGIQDVSAWHPAEASLHTATQIVPAALNVVWMAGIVLMLAYGIYSYVKCRKCVSTAVILMRESKSHRGSVWECDQIPSPFVLGIFRPRIYLPFRMDEKTQQYILAHEECHIRRHDPLWKLAAFLLLSIYWCNPLAWAAFFYMTRDMEMSCDEAVIKKYGSGIKKEYSASLLAFAMEWHPYTFVPVAFGEDDAGRRIKNVLNFRKPHTWITAIVTVVVIAVAVSCLTNQKLDETNSQGSGTQTRDAKDAALENNEEYTAQADLDEKSADEQQEKELTVGNIKEVDYKNAISDDDLDDLLKTITEYYQKKLSWEIIDYRIADNDHSLYPLYQDYELGNIIVFEVHTTSNPSGLYRSIALGRKKDGTKWEVLNEGV